jgi:acetyl esterase
MPLEPDVKLMLDAMASANMNPFEDAILTKTADQLRAALAANRMPAPEVPIASFEDTSFAASDGGTVPVRVYRPTLDASPLPAIVFYHGGGWVIGGLDTHDGSARAMANSTGAVVVFVDYRLAPEARFPVPAEDCYEGLLWTVANADRLGIDASRLAVAGDSAGGNLAAVVALMARDRKGPALRHQLLVYPCTDMEPSRWPSMSENKNGYFLTGLPPAHVITAEFDPLRDEGEAYAAKLAAAGVPTTCERYDGMIHGFFGMTAMFEKSRQAHNTACERLKAALA